MWRAMYEYLSELWRTSKVRYSPPTAGLPARLYNHISTMLSEHLQINTLPHFFLTLNVGVSNWGSSLWFMTKSFFSWTVCVVALVLFEGSAISYLQMTIHAKLVCKFFQTSAVSSLMSYVYFLHINRSFDCWLLLFGHWEYHFPRSDQRHSSTLICEDKRLVM